MLEFLLCSLVTILPDFLFRRYGQNRRWGIEINYFSVWYELRWGITTCVLLTVALITLIFYYHPSTTNVTPMFRTVSILPEFGGRVEEVYVDNLQEVEAGEALFSMSSVSELAAVDTARGTLAETEAAFAVARSDLDEAEGLLVAAESALEQARDDLRRRLEASAINPEIISEEEVDSARNRVASAEGMLASAVANRAAIRAALESVLPAERKTAQEALEQALVELGKTVIYAGVDGQLIQFFLQSGDVVNPILRPAGLLIPNDDLASGGSAVQAAFNQLAAPIVKPGTVAEITCHSRPFTIVPMVVTAVQPVIASGQIRPTDQLIDLQDRARPGSLTAQLRPLYPGGMEGLVPGTKCIANAYTNSHELLASGELGFWGSLYYHMVDAVGVVHAIILRIQALITPVKLLVFAGH
jgi:multidrug resistance efflux pump